MAVASTVQKNRVHQTNISRALNKYFACIKQIFRPRLKKGQRRFLACGVKVKIRAKNSRYKFYGKNERLYSIIMIADGFWPLVNQRSDTIVYTNSF